jgi:signal transduction histidine kinase
MLDNILILSRIESTSFDSNFGTLDLCDLIRQSVHEAEIVDRNKHTFNLECVSGPLVIHTSPEIINRIIDNLFTNATKYTPAGTSIEISLNVVGNEAVIEVSDHGVGIPEDEIEMIFQPFYRGSNVVDTPGTGLGLLIVEKSLQLLGGGIQVHSQVGEGTRVVMHIPLWQE